MFAFIKRWSTARVSAHHSVGIACIALAVAASSLTYPLEQHLLHETEMTDVLVAAVSVKERDVAVEMAKDVPVAQRDAAVRRVTGQDSYAQLEASLRSARKEFDDAGRLAQRSAVSGARSLMFLVALPPILTVTLLLMAFVLLRRRQPVAQGQVRA